MTRHLVPLLALSMGAWACDNATPSAPTGTSALSTSASVVATGGKPSGIPPSVPVKAGGPTADVVAGNNGFGFALYRQLKGDEGNLAYSPASISLALSMTYAGAKGDTAKEMRSTLQLPEDVAEVHGGWATQLHAWQGLKDVDAAIANRLFGEAKLSFLPAFLDVTKKRYGAPLMRVDFAGSPQVQRKRINDWVATQTRDRIKDLIPPPGITGDTRLALVNAMYFKANWSSAFEKNATSPQPFALASGKSVEVPMMSQIETMGYAEVDGVKIAQRFYKGRRFATVFVLPKDDMASLERKLDRSTYDRWIAGIKSQSVHMKLPRFKIEPGAPVELSKALGAMGMKKAFSDGADFSGMSTTPLSIKKVYHKAFVAMDEEGTEAAAATAVIMGEGAAAPPENPAEFFADRPFLFFIRDIETGLITFVGRVMNPS